MRYISDSGITISLGKKLAAGGEGAVFAIQDNPSLVAKIYHQAPSEYKIRKLSAMVRAANADVLKFAAWPTGLLRASSLHPVQGLLMRRIDAARPVHELDTPTHRRANFPHADWRFLIRAARNCAAAMSTLHACGFVVGDVNQGGFLVTRDAIVNVIDCDSFQVRSGGEIFFCEVAVPEFLPPELYGHSLASTIRTANHDAFGLGITIFRLLMMGRHPFAGYRGPGDKPIPEAIKEYRFAYSSDAAKYQMAPPPHSLLLSDLPSDTADLFRRTFTRGSEREGARPLAREWVTSLDNLERQTRLCPADPGHYYFSGNSHCPWCRIEQGRGPNYFISVTIQAVGASSHLVDVAKLWDEITAIPAPKIWFAQASLPAFPPPLPFPLPDNVHEFRQALHVLTVLLLASASLNLLGILSINFVYIAVTLTALMAIASVVVYIKSPLFKVRRERRLLYEAQKNKLNRLDSDINQRCTMLHTEYDRTFGAVNEAKNKLQLYQSQEQAELNSLHANARERQLEDYLERFYIRDARIDGIGPARIAALESFNVETAHDVTESNVSAIPGFGPVSVGKLLLWRRNLESQFRFNPSKGVPQADLLRIKTKYLQLRYACQKQLLNGKENLQTVSAAARDHVQMFAPKLAMQRMAVAQAKADLDMCRSI